MLDIVGDDGVNWLLFYHCSFCGSHAHRGVRDRSICTNAPNYDSLYRTVEALLPTLESKMKQDSRSAKDQCKFQLRRHDAALIYSG